MADLVVECCPTDEECRALVQNILASKDFQRAHRLRDFLLYIVDRKLAHAPHEISEPLIGHRVFGRPSTYNTGEDSIVRTEARLLRQRLERYFANEGAGESIVLEIPKGSYVPVFCRREQPSLIPAAVPPPVPSRRWNRAWLLPAACLLAVPIIWWRFAPVHSQSAGHTPPGAPSAGTVAVQSSDAQLVRSFEWAKQRALGYAYTGDGVGDWYDSTAGTRYAFCMRDVSHQSIGAAVLGLTSHTRNMLGRFAGSISESRDWCGFWEINKDGFPAPIDYKDDRHFWYCLPANFDIMRACYRQFLWTGDQTYFDSVFSNFYDRTVTDYVAAWDKNNEGIMESSPEVRPRGIASYYQEQPRPLVGADLIAAEYVGYLTYAAIQQQKGHPGSLSDKLASEYVAKAEALRLRYNTEWWNAVQNCYYPSMLANRHFYPGYVAESNLFTLLFGLPEDGLKTDAALDLLEKNRPDHDQTLSYYPEILFRYGRNESAYRYLLELTDPNFRSRGMPEIVYAVIGAVATGLAGISPDAPHHAIETLSRLPKTVNWVRLARVPVLGNRVTVLHKGLSESTFTNEFGAPIQWQASFPLPSNPTTTYGLLLDGKTVSAQIRRSADGQQVLTAFVRVNSGESKTVKVRELTVN
jgi:hypothetical protein